MARNILGGFGDMCGQDEPEDTRPVCSHCGKHHDGSYRYEEWCSPRCAILGDLGGLKRKVVELINRDMSYEYVIYKLTFYGWFDGVSDFGTDRWLRDIRARMEQDRAILAQAREIENYHNGY